jgi:hypothetical protein
MEHEESGYMTEDMCSTDIWKMFDGALSCEGVGAGVLFVAPEKRFIVPFLLHTTMGYRLY